MYYSCAVVALPVSTDSKLSAHEIVGTVRIAKENQIKSNQNKSKQKKKKAGQNRCKNGAL